MLCKIMTGTYGIGHILHWNDRNLLEFPEDLKQHKDQVHQLYIKNNFIEILPRWISSLYKLTHIYVGNNKLSSLPDEMSQLRTLEVLCAPCNLITDIPPTLSALNRLTQLDLSHNVIKKVPHEILNMRSLWLMDLSHNDIETLPEIDPDELYLGEIILNSNKLLCVPDNIARLKNIEYLSLAHNNLLYMPAVIFRPEAMIKVDHNAYLNYVPINVRAENCGSQGFPDAHMLPNSMLKCGGNNLIISPKIKQVFRVQGNAHCPSLKEFSLRSLHTWRTPFAKNQMPKNLLSQLLSGPAATCMQCSRPLFTYSYICLFQNGSMSHFVVQYFCSKSCYSTLKQCAQIHFYQQEIVSEELDFEIKPYGYLPS